MKTPDIEIWMDLEDEEDSWLDLRDDYDVSLTTGYPTSGGCSAGDFGDVIRLVGQTQDVGGERCAAERLSAEVALGVYHEVRIECKAGYSNATTGAPPRLGRGLSQSVRGKKSLAR